MADTYPKRPAYFAHKLVRLMLHSCAAQEIGPDGFLLVTAIAHAEDAKRYSGAVTYWNEQLIPILGFGSWGQLDRARKKAVAGGWLHYEEGGKGKVGKYWTTVPTHLLDAPDVSTEADHHVSLYNSGEDSVKETGKKRDTNVREPRDNRGTNEGQPGDNRGASGEHSTLLLIPTPNPSPSPTPNTSPQAAGADAVVNANGTHKRKRAAKAVSEYSDDFVAFWEAFPPHKRTEKPRAWELWQEAVKAKDAAWLIGKATEYAASDLGQTQYANGAAVWLSQSRYDDHPSAWSRGQKQAELFSAGNPDPRGNMAVAAAYLARKESERGN